jgi:hypothetical protein
MTSAYAYVNVDGITTSVIFPNYLYAKRLSTYAFNPSIHQTNEQFHPKCNKIKPEKQRNSISQTAMQSEARRN